MNEQKSNKDILFNENFCTYLEYHLGQTFENSDRQDVDNFDKRETDTISINGEKCIKTVKKYIDWDFID